MARGRKHWLFKSEPQEFSIQDLAACPGQRAEWDGVRNYQARNLLRDEIQEGDLVLFYHSRVQPPAVVGIARVVKGGHPDSTQFDPSDPHHDPRSSRENPRWYAVDIQLERIFERPVTLPEMRSMPALEGMMLLRRGARLSVQPVTSRQWHAILRRAGEKSPS